MNELVNYPNWAFIYPLPGAVVQYHGKLNNLPSLRLGSCLDIIIHQLSSRNNFVINLDFSVNI